MKKSPAFQFYPSDWLSSTHVSLMTPAEEGAYIRLLCHAWASDDCGLPDDDAVLAELSRMRAKWKASGPKIRKCFERVGDRLFNPRLIEEHQKQLEWRRKSSEGGQLSARKRKGGSRVVQPPLKGGCEMVGDCLQPNSNSSSSSSTSSTIPTLLLPDDGAYYPNGNKFREALREAWVWFCENFPGNVVEGDGQTFVSVIQTFEDIALLRKNLPKWMEVRTWKNGYPMSVDNFLRKRAFRTTPKPDAPPPVPQQPDLYQRVGLE